MRLPTVALFHNDIEEARYLLGRLDEEYPWAFDLAHQPYRAESTGGGGSGHSDPTGATVTNDRRQATRRLTSDAARRLDNAVLELRVAFAAVGEAIRLQDRPGPDDHVQAPFHDPATLYPGRPDLAEAHAARTRRHERGEL